MIEQLQKKLSYAHSNLTRSAMIFRLMAFMRVESLKNCA